MIEYHLFEAGFCLHCQRITLKNGLFKSFEYPAICALIKHPTHGYILFDTGYSDRFYQLTQKFPFSLYQRLTPVVLSKSLKQQLKEKNIDPEEIEYIVISHFHADHIGGLRDFPHAQFICHADALADIQGKKGIRALLKGFLPDLLPSNFHERLFILDNPCALPSKLSPFQQGFDVFGDGQLFLIPLPGHAKGQIGLYFKAQKETFLIADSCWHQESFQQLIYPSELTYIVHDHRKAYLETLQKLHLLYRQHPELDMIPSHCQHIRARLQKKSS